MRDPIPPDLQTRIRQAFLLGLARQPVAPPPSLAAVLPPGSEPALALLALAGQRQRFAGPPPVNADAIPEAARALHADPRPILPAPARRALHRLAGSVEKSLAASVMPIALRRVGAAGCRLHPFDLPGLARHFKDHAEQGMAERAYLALTAGDAAEEVTQGLFFDRITAENWTTFPKAQRRMFVADVRRNDPAAGRTLIESVWKTEPAPVRSALLEALAVGLGADDKPFLERLATDRAESVRQAAQRLLARMPDTESFAQRLAKAAQCFKRTGKNISLMAALGMRGKQALTFEAPAGLPTSVAAREELTRLFTDLPLAALAGAVGAAPAEIVTALPDFLRLLLLDAAAAEDDSATVQCIVRTDLLAARSLAPHVVMSLANRARRPLDPDAAAALLATDAWKSVASSLAAEGAAPKDDGRLIFTATLMPREAMPAFVASLDAAPLSTVRAAKDFADFILALPA